MQTPAFGAVFVKQDPRDYILKNVGSDVPRPAVYRPDYSSIPFDFQGKQPACGSHAGAFIKNVKLLAENKAHRTSPRYLWDKIKQIDGVPLSSGTDIYSILKTLQSKGVCDFDQTGNDVTLSLEDYANPFTTPEIEATAVKNEISRYATTFKPTMEQIKQAIYVNGAVIVLMRVGMNMYKPSWSEKDILPLSPTRFPMDSGHFVVAIGYDENYIYWRNSWGNSWGQNGTGYFGANYIPYVDCIASIVDPEMITPAVIPPSQDIPQKLGESWYSWFVRMLKGYGLYNK